MGYERNPRGTGSPADNDGRNDARGYGRDDGPGRDGSYSSARDYRNAGGRDHDRGGYGGRDYGNQRYRQRDEQYGRDGGYRGYDGRDDDRGSYGAGQGRQAEYHGSYASDGRRFEDVGRYAHADDDYRRGGADRGGSYGAQPQGYDYRDRGFIQRAGDEVRSWFGDDEAERRREFDQRYDERAYGQRDTGHRDHDYHHWRSGQIAALDRDYDEYRQQNRSKFESEFSTWRTSRQGQRDLLGKVREHLDVVGSDGEHVGTVDKVRGDRIILTRSDADAGGRHHSIPSSWLQGVDDKVTLGKTAADAKRHWQDEERNQALFGDRDDKAGDRDSVGNRMRTTTY